MAEGWGKPNTVPPIKPADVAPASAGWHKPGETSTGQQTLATVGSMPSSPAEPIGAVVLYNTPKGKMNLASVRSALDGKSFHLSTLGDDALKALNQKIARGNEDSVIPFVDPAKAGTSVGGTAWGVND